MIDNSKTPKVMITKPENVELIADYYVSKPILPK